jgi:hypothetical protein
MMPGKRRWIGLFLAPLLLCPPLRAAPDAPPDRCQAPSDLIEDGSKLPDLARRIADRQPIKIIAVGGASTAGAAANAADKAYPHRLQEALLQRYPGLQIAVLNRGVPRQSAEEMVERFDKDVLPEAPNFVLWETGITDAVRGVEVGLFADAVQTGLDTLRDRHIEVMLIDMQYSRRAGAVIDFEPYRGALHRIADVNGVRIFPRYEIMQYWTENGFFDFDNVAQRDRATEAAALYDCLAKRMADAIDYAIH